MVSSRVCGRDHVAATVITAKAIGSGGDAIG
jgi:hypothetical protein